MKIIFRNAKPPKERIDDPGDYVPSQKTFRVQGIGYDTVKPLVLRLYVVLFKFEYAPWLGPNNHEIYFFSK